jgi:hypothetical protein
VCTTGTTGIPLETPLGWGEGMNIIKSGGEESSHIQKCKSFQSSWFHPPHFELNIDEISMN